MLRAPALAAVVVAHAVSSVVLCSSAHAGSSFASAVVDFDQGMNPTAGYDLAAAALGEPARFTGEDVFPSVVSPFSPPFLPDEIFSIGVDGFITLAFDAPITNSASNPFGIDFIVFDNAGFIDGDFPNGVVAGAFGNDPFVVEVSDDGRNWFVVTPASDDGLFPTCGDLDSGPFDGTPGTEPTDFTTPVDPAFTSADLFLLTYEELLERYDGSGGGIGFDIETTGLTSVNFVRISNPGDPRTTASVEIDAVARVTPGSNIADFVGDDFQPPADGVVDGFDLAFLLGQWGASPGSPADIVSDTFLPPPDGLVDGFDLAVLLGEWTE
jgi:hypothetical protein